MRRYYNELNDILVTIKGDEFVILGDESQVSDDEIMAMYNGTVPAGWILSSFPS